MKFNICFKNFFVLKINGFIFFLYLSTENYFRTKEVTDGYVKCSLELHPGHEGRLLLNFLLVPGAKTSEPGTTGRHLNNSSPRNL